MSMCSYTCDESLFSYKQSNASTLWVTMFYLCILLASHEQSEQTPEGLAPGMLCTTVNYGGLRFTRKTILSALRLHTSSYSTLARARVLHLFCVFVASLGIRVAPGDEALVMI